MPFGKERAFPGYTASNNPTELGFTGHHQNSELGLVYMNARFYVSGIGRFANADTIIPNEINPQSFNRYSYVFNNPLNYKDFDGHDPWWCDSPSCVSSYYGAPTATEILFAIYTDYWWYQHNSMMAYDGSGITPLSGKTVEETIQYLAQEDVNSLLEVAEGDEDLALQIYYLQGALIDALIAVAALPSDPAIQEMMVGKTRGTTSSSWASVDEVDNVNTGTSRMSDDEAFELATRAVNDELDNLSNMSNRQASKRSVIVGAVNVETGEVVVGVKMRGTGDQFCAENNALSQLGTSPTNSYLTQAKETHEQVQDKHGISAWLSNLGLTYYYLKQIEKAATHMDQARELCHLLGDKEGEGTASANLGLLYAYQKNYPLALSFFEKSREINHSLGASAQEGIDIGNIGNIYLAQGHLLLAEETFHHALEIAKNTQDKQSQARWLASLANIYAESGRKKDAKNHYLQAKKLAQEIGDQITINEIEHNLTLLV